MYYRGTGVAQDGAKALEWYTMAAAQDDVESQRALGGIYYYGLGVPKDLEKTVGWWTKAAEQGDARAQANLGLIGGA